MLHQFLRRVAAAGLLLTVFVALLAGRQAAAQSLAMADPVALRRPPDATSTMTGRWDSAALPGLFGSAVVAPAAPSPKSAPWWAPAASLVVPGAGQAALRQARSAVYVAAEAFLWLRYASARSDLGKEERRFREIAADVARKRFGGTLPPGSWEYYEFMEKFLESGAFDRVPGGALDPETDTLTYNGARWLLARQNNWLDPNVTPATTSAEYQRALAVYRIEAYGDEYRWSWRDAQLQQDVYKQTIVRRNQSFQLGTTLLGLAYANHLVSMIDAYIGVRVRRFGGAGIGGLAFDGLSSRVEAVGAPAQGAVRLSTRVRFIPRQR